ncbi:MAG: hypothetical protein QOG38_689 [Hyphomicrobiales bacterium]|nr:hypothetical protein [Hyphomicrobiales bacterium]
MLQFQNSNAQDHRRKARMCGNLAAFARSKIDRTQLLRMRDALLARAAIGDWFDSLPPMPPANSNALTARHA